MIKFIEPFYFFLSFFFGMLLVYLFTPPTEIVYKYPTPDNVGNVIYKDLADTCYKYTMEEVNCPKDKTKINDIELQHRKPGVGENKYQINI